MSKILLLFQQVLLISQHNEKTEGGYIIFTFYTGDT
jgi:hypothetical protein